MIQKNYYAAYGSNLNRAQMLKRCPESRPVCKATIPNWRLVFRGVADIIPCETLEVNVGIYSITPACELALDFYEDFPNLYSKQHIEIETESSSLNVMLYTMNPGYGYGIPSEPYFRTIREGYQDWGIHDELLICSVKHAKKYDSDSAYESSFWNSRIITDGTER